MMRAFTTKWVVVLISVLMVTGAEGSGIEPIYTPQGFRIPTPGPIFSFPRDHGSHPEFRIEWWYVTGHLRDDDEGRYGFQATFFRVALAPHEEGRAQKSFGTNQLMMAHMALADLGAKRFMHEERLNREGWDAWARVGGLDLRNGNWTLVGEEDGAMTLVGSIRSDASFSLRLAPVKGPVLFGEQGLSRKGASETAASWYITFPRLGGEGTERMLIRPLMDEQEMVGHLGGVSYWEGACEVIDAGGVVIGEAYVELTGYAEELTDALR